MLTKRGGLASAAFGILGVAALLFLLWRPACELSTAHAAGDPAGCCTMLAEADAFTAADAAAAPGGRAPAAPAAGWHFALAPLIAPASRIVASTPLPARPFHARSGRMLL